MQEDVVPAYVGLTPMLPVTNVARSIAFYEQLGFQVGNSHTPDGAAAPVWAWLHSSRSHVMINQADGAIEATHRSVSIWLYTEDVKSAHEVLRSRSLDVSEIEYPFYNPQGEFHVHDPDGYAVFVAQVD